MRADYERFEAAGLGIVAIGLGSPKRTREFRSSYDLPFPLLADPRQVAYQAYGLTNIRLRREANIGAALRFARAALREGGARPEEDPRQLGGVFIVDTGGIIRYAYRSARMSDIPPNDDLLQVAVQMAQQQRAGEGYAASR